jgi:hypothetical protein
MEIVREKCWSQSIFEMTVWPSLDIKTYIDPENHSPESDMSKHQIWMLTKLMNVFLAKEKPLAFVQAAHDGYLQYQHLCSDVNIRIYNMTKALSLHPSAKDSAPRLAQRLIPTGAMSKARGMLLDTMTLDAEVVDLKGALHPTHKEIIAKLEIQIANVVGKYKTLNAVVQRSEATQKDQAAKFAAAAAEQSAIIHAQSDSVNDDAAYIDQALGDEGVDMDTAETVDTEALPVDTNLAGTEEQKKQSELEEMRAKLAITEDPVSAEHIE